MNDINNIKNLALKDLNLLITFQALIKFKNVTRASEAMNVSQSAMSHALSRLRRMFDDELFVKIPKGVSATPKALALQSQIEDISNALSNLLLKEEVFSLETLNRVFRIKTTDLIEALLAPMINEIQSEQAPLSQFSFTNVGFSFPKEGFESGEIDLAIAGFFGKVPDGFF